MNIFEKYPLPWTYVGGRYVDDAGRYVPLYQLADGLLELRLRQMECVNALDGIENPVQWVADAKFTMEENASLLSGAKQRIAELEQQLSQHPEKIKSAIHFFTMSNIPLKYIEQWSNGIDPTATEEQ